MPKGLQFLLYLFRDNKNKAFKNKYNATPTEYRKLSLENNEKASPDADNLATVSVK